MGGQHVPVAASSHRRPTRSSRTLSTSAGSRRRRGCPPQLEHLAPQPSDPPAPASSTVGAAALSASACRTRLRSHVVVESESIVTSLDPDWRALQRVIGGEVILPASPAYDLLRKPAFARF